MADVFLNYLHALSELSSVVTKLGACGPYARTVSKATKYPWIQMSLPELRPYRSLDASQAEVVRERSSLMPQSSLMTTSAWPTGARHLHCSQTGFRLLVRGQAQQTHRQDVLERLAKLWDAAGLATDSPCASEAFLADSCLQQLQGH